MAKIVDGEKFLPPRYNARMAENPYQSPEDEIHLPRRRKTEKSNLRLFYVGVALTLGSLAAWSVILLFARLAPLPIARQWSIVISELPAYPLCFGLLLMAVGIAKWVARR